MTDLSRTETEMNCKLGSQKIHPAHAILQALLTDNGVDRHHRHDTSDGCGVLIQLGNTAKLHPTAGPETKTKIVFRAACGSLERLRESRAQRLDYAHVQPTPASPRQSP